jgi:hypothetical protein
MNKKNLLRAGLALLLMRPIRALIFKVLGRRR